HEPGRALTVAVGCAPIGRFFTHVRRAEHLTAEGTMRVASLGLAAALLVAAAPGPGAGPDGGEGSNLLVNGSFEEGPDPGAFLPVNKDSTDIKGWTVTRGQIDYIGSFWPAADGKRSLDLHGSPGFGGVSQTFPTVKGQKYRVTFALAGNPEGTVPKK